MKKIDHVYVGPLTSAVGPSGTVRRILKNRQFFLENGLDIAVYNKGKIYQDWEDSNFASFVPTSSSIYHRVRLRLDKMAKGNLLLSILLMNYMRRSRKKTVKTYLSLGRTPDAVVFHSETEAYFYLREMGDNAAKSACFFHSDGLPLKMYYVYYPKLEGSFYAKKLLLKFSHVVDTVNKCVFICRKGQENLNKIFPTSKKKSALVINGIDDLTKEQLKEIEQIKGKRTDKQIKLVSVGSVSIRKGQRLILEALNKLDMETRAKYHLTIIGDGVDMDFCKNYVNKHHLENSVTFTGSLPNNQVYLRLAEADVFVLMSNNEGLPISILEGMRAGLAVLSTNVSGIPELVTNNNGILVDPSSESLYKVLQTPEAFDWHKMGIASRELFESTYTFERMRRDYVNMINSMF